jgi:WD40 repeat protein
MARYDGFISYSHKEKRGIAPRLQDRIEKCAPPWYRSRALHLFLDKRSFGADPELWPAIDREMNDSDWFVLVASPQAAASDGVNHEVSWWLRERSAGSMVIVDADGELGWDDSRRRFDASSTSVPPALQGLREQPHFVSVPRGETLGDLELDEVALSIAAPLREMSRDELVFRRDVEERRRKRIRRGTIAVLLALLGLATVAAVIAFQKNEVAEERAKVSLSRQIAAASEAAAPTDLDTAMLLAVAGFRTDPNPQTRAALFSADTASPGLVRFLPAGSKVDSIAGAAHGGAVVVGTVYGEVLLWPSGHGEPRLLSKLSRGVESVAVSGDGSVVAATDSATAMLWRRGRPPVRLPVPKGAHARLVGLSPSGRTVVYAAGYPDSENSIIMVAPVSDPKAAVAHSDPIGPSEIAVQSDRRVLLASPSEWILESLSPWSGAIHRLPFGAHVYGLAVSSDGKAISDTNGDTRVPVWRTAGRSSPEEPDSYAQAPVPQQIQIALSPGGSKLAVAAPGQLYVARVTPATQDGAPEPGSQGEELLEERPRSLTGQTPSLVTFVDSTHLLSASGRTVAIWDTEQLDRLADAETVPLEFGCELCGPPSLSISPDGRRLTVVNGSNSFAFVQALDGSERHELPDSELEFSYGSPVWGDGGRVLAFPVSPAAGGENPTFPIPRSLPSYVRLWTGGDGKGDELVDGPADGGRDAVVADAEGGAFLQDVVTGLKRSSWRTGSRLSEEEYTSGALNRTGRLLALAREGEVRVERVPGGEVVFHLPLKGFPTVSYTAGHLLVQLADGTTQVRDETGVDLERTLPGDSGEYTVVSPTANFVGRASDGTIALAEFQSGTRLATFRTPGESFFYKTGLAFTPDGKVLVSISEEPGEGDDRGQLVRRDLSDASLVQVACAAAGRDLTEGEWRAAIGTDPPGRLSCDG